jgi:hypothetical protein
MLSDFWMVGTQPINRILLPFLLYHAYKPRKLPKSGICLSPISSISHHHAAENMKTACQLLYVTILVSFPRHSPPIVEQSGVYPGAVASAVGMCRIHPLPL